MYRATGGVCEADHEYGKRAEGDSVARRKPIPCSLPSNEKVDVIFYGLAEAEKHFYLDVRVVCGECHGQGFRQAVATADKEKREKYSAEVAGVSQSAFPPFVVGSHGGGREERARGVGFAGCASQAGCEARLAPVMVGAHI
jgi:hypothetical protein